MHLRKLLAFETRASNVTIYSSLFPYARLAVKNLDKSYNYPAIVDPFRHMPDKHGGLVGVSSITSRKLCSAYKVGKLV